MCFQQRLSRLLTILLISAWPTLAWTKTLALTFDDGFNPSRHPETTQWNSQLLAILHKHKIQAALFPSLTRIGGTAGLELVNRWAQEGHQIGNHTANHRNLADDAVSVDQFIADIQAADSVLHGLPTFTPMLRFPYLKEGNTQAKRDGIRKWMANNGYKTAAVSIDASDWYYNLVYSDQLKAGDRAKAEQVKHYYIQHLLDRANYYDQLAHRVLKRSPPHIMLLHTNQLNAETLSEIITALTSQGWTIISARTAFADPLYNQAPDILPAGESIIWAHAKAANIPDLRYPAEDAIYEQPRLKQAGLLLKQ